MDILSSFSPVENFRQLTFERMRIDHPAILGIILENFLMIQDLHTLRVIRNNSFLIVVSGDFNTKSKGWHNSDKTLKSVGMVSQFSLYEVIKNQPT